MIVFMARVDFQSLLITFMLAILKMAEHLDKEFKEEEIKRLFTTKTIILKLSLSQKISGITRNSIDK